MSFIKCLQSKVDEGLLSKGQLKTLERKFNAQKERYTDTMGDADAANKAALDIMTAEGNLIADKKRNTIKAALIQNSIRKSLLDKVEKGQAFDAAVRDVVEDAYLRKGTILKQYFSNMDKFADEYRSKFAGLHRRQDGIRDVVGELLGKNTGDAEAKQFSTAVRKTYEIANKRYKNAGGIMGDLENYHPTTHQKEAIEKVSFEKWYSDLEPRLDQSKMIDRETGLPFTRKKLLAEMKEDYDGIITNGRSGILRDIESGKSSVGKSKEISNKRIASRFYMFKDADSFLEYNDLYGVGDSGLYDSIINHLESLARDTAILEKMGPKPNALMRSLDLEMLARDTKDFKRKWTNGMYQVLNGYVDSSVGEGWIFRTIGNTKNLLSAALLGAAPISAISDTAFVAATAKINGLSATKTLTRYAKLLNPASSKDRNLAKRSGYIADIARGSALADVRFTGENMGGKATGWLAQFTNRASGLQAMTKAAADASSMELEATLAELAIAKTDWANVDKTFKDALELHGVTKDDWDIIKKADVFSPEEGVSFLRSQDLLGIEGVEARRLLDVGNKIDDFSQSLRMVATNEPTLRTRAINTGAALGSDARRGTAIRGLSATFLQFKSFPMTVMFNHMIPSIKSAKQGKFGHAAYTFAGASILGGAALMLKDIVKGRDPRDPNDPRFWGAAVLQGGGLGIFGDFLFGRSELADAIGGPVVGLAEDVRSTLVGNLEKLADDPTPKTIDRIKRDAFNLARRNIPASTLWYSRLVVERYILDQLEEMVDPDYQQRVRRLENRMINQTGQEYFWRKGETSPDRGPQITEK